ncbi:MAG TPA: hypothetical protein VFV75_18650 [Candidatus Polarisedimenticolaceae bacterium]|nr:hypothetical protein [Candidatus Polarisedimenticolaceae bacterium]
MGGKAHTTGASLVEVLAVLAIAAAGLAIAGPAAATLRTAGRGTAAARQLALELQAARWRAVARARPHGLLFERDARGWSFRLALDGNGNGMRTQEVRSGTDPTVLPPRRLEDLVEHVRLGLPAGPAVPRIPPGTGTLDPDDPVQFGVSDLVAFGAVGGTSSGTIYLTDGADAWGVVLFGPSCRVRVWHWDRRHGWTRR